VPTDFQALVEALTQIVWVVAPDGRLEYLSPSFYRYSGLESSLPDERLRAAVHPEDLPKMFERGRAAHGTGVHWELEFRLRRHDGQYRWHLARSMPVLDDAGQLERWYGSATDIDDQKRAVRGRDELIATVSHDLRNPLGSVLMAAALIRRAPADQAKVLKNTEMVERNVQRMESLIQDLLDAEAIDRGKLSIDCGPHELALLVSESVEAQQLLAREKALTLTVSPPPAGVIVQCDRNRLAQVFANLIGNAIKFTPRGGAIAVEHSLDEREVRFDVSDTGPGISGDELSLVFDRFWRRPSSKAPGSGLGLAIARGIVEHHGGRIWAESPVRDGAGTRFSFTLPLARR
jgi:PAS domain S-box-containing protein